MTRVGLIVNPAAGRDVRRLAGSAVVSDNYAKRRTAAAVLAGLELAGDGFTVLAMPDRAGIAEAAIGEAPPGVEAGLLDQPVTGTREDTRTAAATLRDSADAVVVLGGDGTTRDVALAVGDVPVAAVSTGTNNVVPTHVDGTAAGAAAGLLAAGAVPTDDVTVEHDLVSAVVEEPSRRRAVSGLATVGVVDRPFVGTRAITRGRDFVGGVVSRATPGDVGLSGVVGALRAHAPDDPGGVGIRLAPPGAAPRVVRAVTVPGVVERFGVAECRPVADGEAVSFTVDEGVVSVDGERDLEVTDATVRLSPASDGPRIVRFDAALETARRRGRFED